MNNDLQKLQAYPFEKLSALKAQAGTPPADLPHIALSIGEPRHQPPRFVLDALQDNLDKIAVYPSTKGSLELREAIAQWLTRRFRLDGCPPDPETQILPVNGTREALFAIAQAAVQRGPEALVLSPNPFYQIYEGAAFLAGAGLHLINCGADTDYLPDFGSVKPSVWERCQLIYLCSPGNPTGAVLPREQLQTLIELAHRHDFIIASDECYSEIYFDEEEPPVGLLQVCAEMGRHDFSRCLVFHSLSKRSNLPGLRSGFVAGDAKILKDFLLYRTYHGCAMSLPMQIASACAWSDEEHVRQNRALYRQKFAEVLEILSPSISVRKPEAGFYMWLNTPEDDQLFARDLYHQQAVTVLPGSYIAREWEGTNPGQSHVRIALVAEPGECTEAARRIRNFIDSL
ncbi:succinyldiaminopimelate transaminase [Gilvimarinus sp. F26214L]|uniref:succinyldiaminopimelate transaminase n=1 Tax=Gilvimarinus sp. DZF01 TaxID=3461371 RepID=UPI004045CEBB